MRGVERPLSPYDNSGKGDDEMKDFGENVKIEKKGRKLLIEIDLDTKVGETTSGNDRLAKTGGFQGYQPLEIEGEEYGLQVGLFKKTGQKKGSKVVSL